MKCLFVIAFSQVLNAQQIYTNGGLSTGATAGSGSAAPAGTTWSECQSETGNTTEANTNAVKDMLTITAPTDATINGYEIFDINGKMVKALESKNATISQINVAELSVGNYLLKLKSDKGTATKKFIKE